MKPFWMLALALSVAGCNLLNLLDGGGDNGQGGASSSSTTGTPGPSGIDCGTDPDTSASLCLGTSLCPGLLIDTEAFPRCGFRINGNAIDVECSCGGYLCPLGAVASCDDLKTALGNSNEGTVCAQAAAGTCVQGTPVATTTAAAGGGTCDTACRDDCGGDPTCIVGCGC